MPSIRKSKGGFNTGAFPEKVMMLTKYDQKMLLDMHVDSTNKTLIERSAANLVARYFEQYIDSKAKSNPEKLHHVYEFHSSGEKNSRLFKREIASTKMGSKISYRFINAKIPNDFGYKFPKKATVMENGQPVVIAPKSGKYLQYKIGQRFVKTQKPSYIENPGGDVGNSFTEEFNTYMVSTAGQVLKRYRFFERINDSFRIKRKLIIPKINTLSLNPTAQAASDAKQIAIGTGAIYND